MSEEASGLAEIELVDLIPFSLQSSQGYQGERLEQLMSSIERVGLASPIIVRPAAGGKYEIICGHNRAKAMEALGRSVIRADVRNGLSDEEAIELFYDSNLNQQSFSEWSYSQKIEAIKYSEKMIRAQSQQGKRTDLERKKTVEGYGTSVYFGQKLDESSKQGTTRDKMARRLGIATATLSKYRSIIKLPDDLIESTARLLDQKKITLEAAYRISGLKYGNIKQLVDFIDKYPDWKIDMVKLKVLCTKSKSMFGLLPKAEVRGILIPRDSK